MIDPQHPYGMFDDRTWHEYDVTRGDGHWTPGTMELDYGARYALDSFRRTNIAMPHRRRPEVAQVHSRVGQVPNVGIAWEKELYLLMHKPLEGGPAYIGESGGRCNDGDLPDPELALDTYPGHTFDVVARGREYDPDTGAGKPQSLKARYRCIGQGGFWWPDRFPDMLRTGLWERPDDPEGFVYNYLWARDPVTGKPIGLVMHWWGWRHADNSVSDVECWTITRWGKT